MDPIPVVLFAYKRVDTLRRVLDCLHADRVPLIYAYADAPRNEQDHDAVKSVRKVLRGVGWGELRLVERTSNLGLGRNILAGVSEVAERHEAFIVWEDDLICVPGTYAWMCAVLRQYASVPNVMSVTAWNHPRVLPSDVASVPYFDARAECWVWGAYRRSWKGMLDASALEKQRRAANRGIPPAGYGADLPEMAREEEAKNIWAVRWLYHHFEHGGLCVRPPWSLVEHIGFDHAATNADESDGWDNPPLRPAPPIPECWPDPCEHPECRRLWRAAAPGKWARRWRRLCRKWGFA